MPFGTPSITTAAISLGASIWAIYKVSRIGSREPYLPPGPPTVPILGNLLIFPKEKGHFQFAEWAKQYGEIFSLKLGQGTVVVVTSAAAFRELMEQHSAATADRPHLHIASRTHQGMHFAGVHYGDHWRRLRRISHEVLTPQACVGHIPIQQAEAAQLMYELLVQPQDFADSIHRFTFSVMSSVIYGLRAIRYNTPLVKEFYYVEDMWARLLDPSGFPPVDLLPILKLVPARFAEWKRMSNEVRKLQKKLYLGLLDDVEQRVARGEANGSWMESVLSRVSTLDVHREQLAHIGGSLLDVGSETTSASLLSLILVLSAYPEVQRKAQEEIDRVIGLQRAPVFSDVENLPYVQAVIQEATRFRPIAPLLFPRATTEDVRYKDYIIPAGSTIITNFWGMVHDEQVFADEATFDPERFLKNKHGVREERIDEQKHWKEDLAFGSGRRICPGIHLAKNAMTINTLNLLWGFNVGKAKDPVTGAEIEPDLFNYAKGASTPPNPFKCTITPRSAQHAELIRHQFLDAASILEQYEKELSPEDRQYVNDQRNMF